MSVPLSVYHTVTVFLVVTLTLSDSIQEDYGWNSAIYDAKPKPSTSAFVAASSPFPSYGTANFARKCPWILTAHYHKPTNNNCTVLVRPLPDSTEGIAHWLSLVVVGHLFAIQSGCKFLLDYGDGVAITKVVKPLSLNWTVPSNYNCKTDLTCLQLTPDYAHDGFVERIQDISGVDDLVDAFNYRFAYVFQSLLESNYVELQHAFPGFHLETGMACSLGSLFRLAPGAAQVEPDLFTNILPALLSAHNNNTLVMSLYIRTGQTDDTSISSKENTNDTRRQQRQQRAMKIVTCALQLEQDLMAAELSTFVRVLWMVISDSTLVKSWIQDTFSTTTRRILTTSSRGVHTRPDQHPTTRDFAHALIDWYLLGEASHVVITDIHASPSFGATAALRTARPLYQAETCSRLHLMHSS